MAKILSLDLKGSGKKVLVVSMYTILGGRYFSFIGVIEWGGWVVDWDLS